MIVNEQNKKQNKNKQKITPIFVVEKIGNFNMTKTTNNKITECEVLRPEVHSPCKPPPPGLVQYQLSQLRL